MINYDKGKYLQISAQVWPTSRQPWATDSHTLNGCVEVKELVEVLFAEALRERKTSTFRTLGAILPIVQLAFPFASHESKWNATNLSITASFVWHNEDLLVLIAGHSCWRCNGGGIEQLPAILQPWTAKENNQLTKELINFLETGELPKPQKKA